jgi:F0F1-type ATP synthase assembly protein I
MASDPDSGWGKFASTGLELAAGICLGVAIGYWIDEKHNSSPWGVLIGFFLGFSGGMYLLIKDVMRSNKSNKD